MKKLFAMILCAAMLCACAGAEGLPLLTQQGQDMFINSVFLNDEAYPQVILSTEYASGLFGRRAVEAPLYTVLEKPEGAHVMEFDTQYASLFVPDTATLYSYTQYDSLAYETFLAKAESDEQILMDGSRGVAAYYSLTSSSATGHVLVATPEHSKTAKLYIRITVYNLRSLTDEERAARVKDAIAAEVERVQGCLRVVPMEKYWSQEAHKGFALYLERPEMTVTCLFPEMSRTLEDGTQVSAFPFVTKSGTAKATTVTRLGSAYVETEFCVSDYSYVSYKKEDDPDHVTTVTLSDGNAYDIYVSYPSDDGSFNRAYVARVLRSATEDGDRALYLTMELDATDMRWASVEALAQELDAWVLLTGIDTDVAIDGASVPAASLAAPMDALGLSPRTPVPTVAPGAQPDAVPEGPETWHCAVCDADRTTNFCPDCGAARPAQ